MPDFNKFPLNAGWIEIAVVLVSLITLVSGLMQLVFPEYVLGFIGKGELTQASNHFFAIVGMFMALFGGMLLHTVYSVETSKVVVLWASFQKFGAFLADSIGVWKGLFSFLAISVALFDFVSGFLFIFYLKQLK